MIDFRPIALSSLEYRSNTCILLQLPLLIAEKPIFPMRFRSNFSYTNPGRMLGALAPMPLINDVLHFHQYYFCLHDSALTHGQP